MPCVARAALSGFGGVCACGPVLVCDCWVWRWCCCLCAAGVVDGDGVASVVVVVVVVVGGGGDDDAVLMLLLLRCYFKVKSQDHHLIYRFK